MTNEKLLDKFDKLTNALKRLEESLKGKFDDKIIQRDVCIKRFEFTIEIFWKFFKRLLDFSGEKEVFTPRQTMQNAYSFHWINSEDLWIEMLKDRNMTLHVYDEDIINEIFDRIKKYYPEMQKTYDLLKEKFKNELTK